MRPTYCNPGFLPHPIKSKLIGHVSNYCREGTNQIKKFNPYIAISPSNKVGSTVILDRGLHEKCITEMLSDNLTYRKLSKDPTADIAGSLARILQEGVSLGVLSDKNKGSSIWSKTLSVPSFTLYQRPIKGGFAPPLRPIIAGIGSLVENICSWLDD